MATTNFSWTISALNCAVELEGLPNVIKCIHWRYQAEKTEGDKTYFVDTYGASSVGQPNPESFIPYEDITEAEIVSWLETTLPIEAMQAGLEAKIEEQINPTELTPPLPWMPAPITVHTMTEIPVFEEPTTTLENEETV
jgi:hypothetical protein